MDPLRVFRVSGYELHHLHVLREPGWKTLLKDGRSCSWSLLVANPPKRNVWRVLVSYFLLPVPIDRNSKLLRASSRPGLTAEPRARVDVFDSKLGWILWVVDIRPLVECSLLVRLSLGSQDEPGLLDDAIALFEVLPFREVRPLSRSACWRVQRTVLYKCRHYQNFSSLLLVRGVHSGHRIYFGLGVLGRFKIGFCNHIGFCKTVNPF